MDPMALGLGSGWWSVVGQSLDFVGFAILTWDIYPEFAATRQRREVLAELSELQAELLYYDIKEVAGSVPNWPPRPTERTS